jgi:peptidoglycan/LPS O-acetylase OafA/YrhL
MPSGGIRTEHRWKRLDGVDVLRGLAIFFVLMNHVNIRLMQAKVDYTKGLPDQLVSSLVWNGQFGVQIFFAISGFLITSTTLRRWGSLSRIHVRDFYLLRFSRIAPLFLLLVGVLSVLHLARIRHFVISPDTGGLGGALFAAFTFRVNVLEARYGYLPGSWDILWSLSVEEMFYLFFPPICRLLGRGKLLLILLMGFVALGPLARTVFAHGNEIWREYSYLAGMDAIALGCLTALLVSRVRFSRFVLWMLSGLGIAIVIFSLGFSAEADALGLGRNGLNMTILALGTCMITACAAQTQWTSPWVLRPVVRLGQRSYEIYLTHMFIIFGLFELFVVIGKPLAAVPALFVGVILVSGLSGEMVGAFYSEPLNRWLRRSWGEGGNRLESAVSRTVVHEKNSSTTQHHSALE